MEMYSNNIVIHLWMMIGLLIRPGWSVFISWPKAVSPYSLLFATYEAQEFCKSLIETAQVSMIKLCGLVIGIGNGQMMPLQMQSPYGNIAGGSVTSAADYAALRNAEREAITKLWLPH